jgi:hypothetical protein
MEQMMSQEQAKHRDRLARLNRIRELAQEQGDTETVARVDKLLEQEKLRYEAKTLRIQRRKDRMAEFMERVELEKTKKANVADANKDANQTPVEKTISK